MGDGKSFQKTTLDYRGGVFSFIPARYMVATMCLCGIIIQYTIKVTLSVVIVAMVRPVSDDSVDTDTKLINILTSTSNSVEELDVCPGAEILKSNSKEGDFEWDDKLQGQVLAAYYYGYVATQLLGGRLSEILGTKAVLGPGVLIAGLVAILSPLAARRDVSAFIASRVIAGAASGLVIPSMYTILPKWFTAEERSFIGSVIMGGGTFGTVIAMVLSGYMVDIGGWPLSFYVFGGIAVLFIIPWMFLMYDTPDKHPRISDKEKNLILNKVGIKTKEEMSYPVPWVAILTSIPLWAHITMSVGFVWVTYTFLSELPNYLSNIQHYNLQNSGIIFALPYLFSGVTTIISGLLSKWLRVKGYLSHLATYRIFNSICSLGAASCLLGITFVDCDSTVIVILLVLTMVFNGSFYGGSYINHIDLGSNFAGTTAGITYTFINAMGIITPSITGIIINGQQTISQWRIVFYISICVSVACWLIYMIFGEVEEQSWNKKPSEQNKNGKLSKDSMKTETV